jgi:hypothetical protein
MTRDLDQDEDRYECTGDLRLEGAPTEDWSLDIQLAPVDAAENQQETLTLEKLEVTANGKTIESSSGPVTIPAEHQEITYKQISTVDSEAGKRGKMRVTADIVADLEEDS